MTCQLFSETYLLLVCFYQYPQYELSVLTHRFFILDRNGYAVVIPGCSIKFGEIVK